MDAIYNGLDDFTRDTVDNPAEFKLKIKYFLDGSVDFVTSRIKHRIDKSKEAFKGFGYMHSKCLSDDEMIEKARQNVLRANRHAKEKIAYAIRQIGADHMLTLTTRENISDRDIFFKTFSRFIRLVREKDLIQGQLVARKAKRDYPYCSVPEFQERGAFHMHVACVGKQDIPLLRACWYVALGGSINDSKENALGQIDVQFRQKRFGSDTDVYNAFKLVHYLTKYITKDFESDETLGLHRYKVSRQIPPPIIHKQYLMACFSFGEKGFTDAIIETLNIAKFIGINGDLQLWNRGVDLFMVRGFLDE